MFERLESEVGACGALARDAAGPRPAPIRQSHGRDYAGLRTGSWIPCPAGTGAQEYWRGLGSALCFKRVRHAWVNGLSGRWGGELATRDADIGGGSGQGCRAGAEGAA